MMVTVWGCQPSATRTGQATPHAPSLGKMTGEPNTTTARLSQTEYRVLQDRPDRLLVALPNRMIVVASRVTAAPVVSVQVWVKTGSIYEQEHTGAGLSHFLEHLISGGSTSTRPEEQSSAILAAIGARTNAATSLDTVRYHIDTSSSYTDQAIDLLSDWMQNSLITPQEYERERSVIQREFEMGQGEPSRILWKLTQRARYDAHPARHPTIGYLDEFLTVSRDEIHEFYKRMYVPNNMVFVVVGDIDPHVVVDQVAAKWATVQPRPLPRVTFPLQSASPGPRVLSDTADIDQPRLRLAWPGTRLAGSGDYALDLLAGVLGQGESSRLSRSVRDQQRLVNSIGAYNASFAWGEGFFGIDGEVAVGQVPSDMATTPQAWRDEQIRLARQAILDQVHQIVEKGVTPQELARAKRKTMASVIFNAQSVQGLAGRLAGDLIGMKDPDYLSHYAQAIQAVTGQEVQQAAAKFLKPGSLISITLLPRLPDQAPGALVRPTDEPTVDAPTGEPVDLDNAAILGQLRIGDDSARSAAAAILVEPLQRHVLPNGLRLLVGRSTVVPAVAMQIYHLGGLLADQPGGEGRANATAQMREKGTATRTAGQIAQTIEDLGASLSTGCGYNTFYSRAVCLKEDWEKALELLADVTLNPTFPDDEWDKLRPRLLAAIDRETDTWNGELRQRFRQAYFGAHPWSVSPLGRRQVVESLTTQDLTTFHRAHLGASESVMVVVGDIEPDRVVQRVQQWFDAMPDAAPQPLRLVQPQPPKSGSWQYHTGKPLAAAQIGFGPTVDRASDDYPALRVLGAVLSRFPSGWLEEQLRGRGPGLVYAVGAGQFTGLVPGYFGVVFNAQPTSVAEALGRTMSVVDRARSTMADDRSLAAAKAKVLTQEFLDKQTNSDRAADAALNELYGLGLDEPQRFRRKVQAIDAPQLQAAAHTYLRNPVTVVISHEPVPQPNLEPAATQPHVQAGAGPTAGHGQ